MDKPTRLIFDDPKGNEFITSEAECSRVSEWWRDVMEPKEGDRDLNLIVQSRLHEVGEEAYELCRKICQARLHAQDLTGTLAEGEDWEMLKLPIQEER